MEAEVILDGVWRVEDGSAGGDDQNKSIQSLFGKHKQMLLNLVKIWFRVQV